MSDTPFQLYPYNSYQYDTVQYEPYAYHPEQYKSISEQSYPGSMQDYVMNIPNPIHSNPTHTSPDAEEEEETTIVSVSTAFHSGSQATPSDLILCSTDSVLFYMHTRTVHKSSPNAFTNLLSGPIISPEYTDTVLDIPDSSDVVNVILHCLYDTSCAQHSPTFDVLETAVNRMAFYCITPSSHILPGTPLYIFLLSHAPLYPIRLYTLAAHHGLHDLAVHTSSHLLATPLSSVTDDVAEQMGALYLNRLFKLHEGRIAELKRILLSPPLPHPATKECTFEDQKRVTRAWALVTAYLAWDARADLSTYILRSTLSSLLENLSCELCNQGLRDRIKDVVVQWANIKRTI